jgi:hypothetical protein
VVLVLKQLPDVTVQVALVVGIGITYVLGTAAQARLRLDAFNLLFLVMIALGVIVGLTSTVAGSESHHLRAFVPHLMTGIMIWVGYSSFANLRTEYEHWLEMFLDRASGLILWIMCSYLFVYILYWLVAHSYWGPSTGPLLVPFAWYAMKGRRRRALLAAALVILNGKRGPTVALLAEGAVLILLRARRDRRLGWKPVAVLGFVAAAIVLLWTVLMNLNPNTLPAVLAATLTKWSYLDASSADFDLARATAGRTVEIFTAYQAFAEQPVHWLIGAGYGWTFRMGPAIYRYDLHYVHLSIFNFLLQYGLIFFVAFIMVLGYSLQRAYSCIAPVSQRYPAYAALLVIFVGSLVEGLFAYMYGVNAFMWIVLGILAAGTRAMGRDTAPAEKPCLAVPASNP